ncbi:MAG TPA: hypothetical protein VK028_08510 [Micromonosporaceae bacterium]|nr:hypothetical protein [Micromonosporaceae bacterium]
MTRLSALVAAVLVLAVAGCGSDPQPPAAPAPTSPSPSGDASPGASASPSPSAEELIEFTVDGAGPYKLGVTLESLQAAEQLAEVTTGGEVCPQNTYARGTGTWTDLRLAFRPDGRLYMVTNRSPNIPTPSGAWIGTSLSELKTIYNQIPGEELSQGPGKAYLVNTISGRGILFELDESQRVRSMSAADTGFLRTSYLQGTDYC